MVALQVKTGYSILGSLCFIDKLVEKAAKLGYTSLAITDENNMFGVMEFYKACSKYNIKPIIGIELDINDKKIILLAKDNGGYQNLIKLATLKSERELELIDLEKYKEGLILIIPYKYYVDDIYNIYSDKFIGYTMIKEAMNIDNPKVFINDVAFLQKYDYKYLDYLYMIKESKILGQYPLNTHIGRHLMTQEELNNYVSLDVLKEMKCIEERCNVTITYTKGLLPVYDKNIDPLDFLTKLCYKGLSKRLNKTIPKEYEERLKYELEVIDRLGFCNYILVVYDYVKYAKKHDILVGPGRGSAAGCLVCYSIGITDIDPIEYKLLFERFLNPERVTMPDIDVDFDAERRNEVIEYVINKYGSDKVAGIITFNTLGAKQVIRDVARVMNLNIELVNELSKLIHDNLYESYYNNLKFRKMIDSSQELRKLYDIAYHLENLPRHVSIHAAGVVMSNKNITDIIPLYKSQLGMYLCAYSKDYLEELGLLKMDFLGLTNLTFISQLIKEISSKEKLNITFNNIPLNDPKTLQLFNKVDTDGIFQFESPGMKKFLEKLKIKNFEDIILALALYRPGPMDSIDTFVRRREKKEEIKYITPELEPILSSTSGIIVYQEQIMQIVSLLGGYSFAEADLLRRAMSKKKEEILINEKPKFISKCMENGYQKEIAEKVYDLILKFANYGFNRSHSVAYAIIAYKIAFLKTHFYKYFITNILTNVINNDTKTNTYIYELRSRNEKILGPDINLSTNKYIAEKEGIRCPLSIIKGVGTVITNEILREREKEPFTSFISFVARMYSSSINKKVITNLIYAGCFKDYNRKTLITNLNKVINYAEISRDEGLIKTLIPEIITCEEYYDEEITSKELNVFGFYLTNHPVSKYKKATDLNSLEVKNHFDERITLILSIGNIKETITKNNDVMAFITAVDEVGDVTLICFPDVYNKYKDIEKRDIIRVYGRVERRYDKYQVLVNRLDILEKAKK